MSAQEYQRAWWAAHPNREKYRPAQRAWTRANRARVNAQALAWYYRNKAAVMANVRRRQARQKAALCTCCAPAAFKFIYLRARRLKMEVDHVRPLSKGGKHCLHNLQFLTQHDNRVKHARWEAV
jgi:5-methylcytosine-specific restriction endonuclease McrA